MPGIRYIEHDTSRVLLVDLSEISDYRVLPGLIGEAIRVASAGEQPGSLRTLIDLSGTRITKAVISSLKDLSRSNGRLAKATAFVGLNGIWSLGLTLLFYARRNTNHRVIQDRGEAIEWLERQ